MNKSMSAMGTANEIREGNEQLILLTAAAGVKLKSLIAREQKGDFLRVKINGGGCNGLSYKMKFVAEPKRGDILSATAVSECQIRRVPSISRELAIK